MPLSIESFAPSPLPPSRTTVGGAPGSSALGKEEFLQLLVAQLKNQDPMNPSNPEHMAAQLAQFSSLEQLININEHLGTQAGSSQLMAASLNNGTAVGIIGKSVLTEGDRVEITGAGGEVVTVAVGEGGGNGVVTLYDLDGNRVASRDVGAVGDGRQDIELGDITDGLPPGIYRYEISVIDDRGSAVEARSLTRAHIEGVRYGQDGPRLLSGDLEIPLADVLEILTQ